MTPGPAADAAGAGRRGRRRPLAAGLAQAAVLLILVGTLLSGAEGALGDLGLVALAQAIGLAVALLWLAVDRNPLSRQ